VLKRPPDEVPAAAMKPEVRDGSRPMSTLETSAGLLLVLALVLAACRLVATLIAPLGQPPVVGEMIAGVLLGPSLFGWLAPDLHARLFPAPVLTVLYCAAQVGLTLYMFLVGLEFDAGLLRKRFSSALSVSGAGIVAPLALGALLAFRFRHDHALFPAGVASWQAMLFLGAAMSITAFPLLARMIHEAGLSGSPLGALTLAAGSADDAAAWCFLAVVLAGFSGHASVAVLAIGGGLAFVLVAWLGIRPLLARATSARSAPEASARRLLPGVLVLLMLTAWYTDAIGMHAVFGAFVLGASMPRGAVNEQLQRQMAPLTTSLLVPLFFVYSGLNTRIGLVASGGLWGATLLVLLAAFAGKGLACYGAARWQGEPHREALAIGALMNARGLTELVILNVGLERGLITPTLFTMMVIMAVCTTVTAMPAFGWIYGRRPFPASQAA
jgi:Kef-type K+ transport system membrane component KefB